MHGSTQNVPNLLFHAAAVAPRPALKAGFHPVFEIANQQLSHACLH
jgi:hypothetical protein